jgi:endonuclease/exonuclease/phosphatase family metal-dependent hydrolase
VVPVTAAFKVLSAEGFDFQMVSVHTVYKKEISWVRKQEFEFIHQWMNTQLGEPDRNEKDIFFMGDFNANPPRQPLAHHYFDDIFTDTTSYRIIFNEPLKAGQASIRTTVMIPVTNENEKPAYDHLLLSRHTSYAVGKDTVTWDSGIIGVVEFDTIPKWRAFSSALSVGSRISDHRPIWIKIPYDTEDRD